MDMTLRKLNDRRVLRMRGDDRAAGLTGRPPGQAVAPELQAQIGEQLRRYYADLLEEPVPDRFLDLIGRFDAVHGRRHEH